MPRNAVGDQFVQLGLKDQQGMLCFHGFKLDSHRRAGGDIDAWRSKAEMLTNLVENAGVNMVVPLHGQGLEATPTRRSTPNIPECGTNIR